MKYIKALDGVRALAIILVMLFHFSYLVEVGWIGVQLFFVLSGFLITSILLESKEKNLSYYLKKFYWRRSLRIFPLYYLYVSIIALAYLIFKIPEYFNELAPYLFSYTYNYYPLIKELRFDAVFTHFWSLSVEEQFYLIWPFIIYFLSRNQLKVILILLILASPIFRFFIGELLLKNNFSIEEIGEIIYRLTPSQIDAFAIGALIPVFRLEKPDNIKKYFLWLPLLLFIGLGLWNYYYYVSTEASLSSMGYPIGSIKNYQHIWSYTIIDFVSLSLILIIIRSDSRTYWNKVFSNAVFVNIGKISYGMYVYHWLILALLKKHGKSIIENEVLLFAAYLITTYMISWFSYHYFEKIFIKLKDIKFKR